MEPLSEMPPTGRLIALDVGDARIGVATSDPTRLISAPLAVIERSAGDPVGRIVETVAAERAVGVVVGLPRNMDGSEGPQAAKCRRFAEQLAAAIPTVPVVFQDERLTTQEARSILLASGAKKKRRAQPVDAVSAALILESYMDGLRARAPREQP